jgi:hypothetical protein
VGTDVIGDPARAPTSIASRWLWAAPVFGVAAVLLAGAVASAAPAGASRTAGASAPAGAIDALVSVSCPAANDCVAVGSSGRGAAGTPPSSAALLEQWNGSTWRVVTVPVPKQAVESQLMGISCVSTSACTVTGVYVTSVNLIEPFFLSWNGTAWSLVLSPGSSTGSGAMLEDISCVSTTACLAVGANLVGNGSPRAELWNGTKWSVLTPPSPAHSTTVELSGVSCSAANACMVVGLYLIGGLQLTLAETWNGRTWAIHATPGGDTAIFDGVTCVSATACLAVGQSVGTALAASWNGRTWTGLAPKTPKGTTATLFGVSCSSSSSCLAVGAAQTTDITNPVSSTLAESWNGQVWTVLRPVSPAGGSSTLSAVAATSASSAIAVGNDANTLNGGEVTLGEALSGSKWAVLATVNP